jgi:hypothetical protein
VVWRLSSMDDCSLSPKCKVRRYKGLGRGESGVLLRASRFVFHVTQKSLFLAKFHFRPPRHVNAFPNGRGATASYTLSKDEIRSFRAIILSSPDPRAEDLRAFRK